MSSKGLEMPVSGSDKLEIPVLGCRFSEKAEHLPIKKRRFVFKTSSPPHNTASSDVPESAAAACLDSSNQEIQPKPAASCPSAESLAVASLCQNGSIDNKVHGEKFAKSSDDICGISLGSYGTKSLEPRATIKLEPNSVNLPNISAKETGLHISTVPLKNGDCLSPDKARVDNSTLDNQLTSQGQKSAVCDERLNWDLNTVMAWEESPEYDHKIHTAYPEGNNTCKEGNSKVCKQEQVSGSTSENLGNKSLTNLRSLPHTIHEKEPEERKPNSKNINKLLFPVIHSAPPHVTVNNIKSLHAQNLDISNNAVPNIVKVEHPTCDISKNHVNLNHKNGNDFVFPMTVNTGFSLDYSLPPGFNPSINTRPLEEENVVSGSNVNHAITSPLQTTENENLNLSLVTVASLENEVHQSGTSFEEDDKTKVKRLITSNCMTMENLIDKGSPRTPQDAYKAINQSTIGSLLAIQSSVLPEDEEGQPCSDALQMAMKPEKSASTPPSVSYSKEACQVGVDNGIENFPSDIQGSEVDNVEEFSVGYDSQFEDGEVRGESSIQTWEGSGSGSGSEGDNRENEHEHNSQCVAPESSSRIRSNTDIASSQKGADEISISSVVLAEQVSNSTEPNETNTREVSMKDESESDQWKMNVSGSEDYNVAKMKDMSSIKLYNKRETSTPTTTTTARDVFINRGSRFRMQGHYSSNNGGDDSASRSREPGVVRSSSFRRGGNNRKYSPHVRASNRGGATWNRSPGRDNNREPPLPFFRDVDTLTTNEVCQNDDVIIRPGAPYRQSFRPRLVGNQEEDDFRARLGLRPAGDTHFVGRGRSLRYNPRGGGPRVRYSGPANDGYNEQLEYSHSFKRRCYSPTERRENQNQNHLCGHHHSGSTSPPRSCTRSRSPRIRRPRSPDFRFEEVDGGYNNNDNNSPPGSSTNTRWVKYKQRTTVFNRSPPPPPPPIGERLSFYDSSRKTKQNENYRSGHPGRFSDVMDHHHGYRRGGFVRRNEMGRPLKHNNEYDEEDGYAPVQGMDFHGRGNPKPYSNGPDTRFRDLPRRAREERENW
ncbi:unnamed protein product [Lactuca saligna]|uniref:Uncharacterized protein n=1 Tax=Lactuca saligna TaxID=75948 RepID=A0AA35YIB9_LACSI|nr:unnamed protein product [Lactuca saligna]